MQLTASTRSFGKAIIVDCGGKIVFGEETTFLRDRVKEALSESKQVVINLKNVNYIDSSGVGTLVGLHASVQSAGGHLKLAGLTGRVRDVLVITKLATIFETHETAEEAASSFNPGAGQTKAVEWRG